MSKKNYETPAIEVIEFDVKDSIATSGSARGLGELENIWGSGEQA